MKIEEIIQKYITFFEKLGHKRIPNSPLVPENDPTTLFTSSGMQPLVPYLLGEPHPLGKRLVNVQNCFRAADIDEVGDNRHTTFFRMLGNWSLGGYFKKEQLNWCFEFFTKILGIDYKRLHVSVFEGLPANGQGDKKFNIPCDQESAVIWKEIFENAGLDQEDRIFYYDASKTWWSRAGEPKDMPKGEPGGPDSEVFYDFGTPHNPKFGKNCHPNCECGRFLEIGNSVFMQYKKTSDGFVRLPQKNVDFGGGLERLLAVVEKKPDIFQTSLFFPIIKTIEKVSGESYQNHAREMRIMSDHFTAAVFIANSGIVPSNKEHGYILRRLIRRGLDNFYKLKGRDLLPIIETVVKQYHTTDKELEDNFEKIKNVIFLEKESYKQTLEKAKKFLSKRYPSTDSTSSLQASSGQVIGDELMGMTKISAEDAFLLYSTHGLSPTQIKNLGFVFNNQEFAQKMEEHQKLSRTASSGMFKGGLADTSEIATKYHTATHLLHATLRKILGEHVVQKGSNITAERLRFDFSHGEKLTDEQIGKVEDLVNEKIKENLPVTKETMDKNQALKSGALGFFVGKYGEKVTVYTVGGNGHPERSLAEGELVEGSPFSREICGGPHVDFTGKLKRFKIIKQENIGGGQRRIYAVLEK